MLFIGHTRFSLFEPNSGAWVASNNSKFTSEDEYRAYLFSEERLSLRTKIFTEYSLPILASASSGYEYFHVVSYSDTLPAAYESALTDAAEEYPFVILNKYVGGHCTSNTHHVVARLFGPGGARSRGEAIGLFRLDDDDLVTADYFRRMAQHVREDNVGYQVSFARGITALYRDGLFENFRETYHPMNSMGLLSVGRVTATGQFELPKEVSHTRSDRANPVILDARHLAYLWVRHETQDTTLLYDGASKTVDEMNRFPVLGSDVDLKALFPSAALKFD